MANPVGCIQRVIAVLKDSSDRSKTYSFGMTWQHTSDGTTLETPSGLDQSAIVTGMESWLNVRATGASEALCFYLGVSASRASLASEIVTYDISNALGLHEDAGAPYSVLPFTLGASANTGPVPEQCAQTVAWRAAYGSDPEFGTSSRPRADDRNRLYFGPLDPFCLTYDAESPARVAFITAFLTDQHKALQAFNSNVNPVPGGSSGWQLVAWSRKNAAIKLAVDFSQNAYPTTQRRRVSSRPDLLWTPFP